MPGSSLFDLFLMGAGPRGAVSVLTALEGRFSISAEDAARFLDGGKLCLVSGIERGLAEELRAELTALGAPIAVEPSSSMSLELSELDQFDIPAATEAPAAPTSYQDFGSLALVSLDGEAENGQPLTEAPVALAQAYALEDLNANANANVGANANANVDANANANVNAHANANVDANVNDANLDAHANTNGRASSAADTFAAPSWQQQQVAIDLPPPPAAASAENGADEPKPAARPTRCPRHRVVEVDGECPQCRAEREYQPVTGRLFDGALRTRPLIRLAVGLALGILVGFIFALPYATRGHRHVAALHAAANQERARPLDEARAHAVALDAQANALAAHAETETLLIWMGLAGVALVGWYRLT